MIEIPLSLHKTKISPDLWKRTSKRHTPYEDIVSMEENLSQGLSSRWPNNHPRALNTKVRCSNSPTEQRPDQIPSTTPLTFSLREKCLVTYHYSCRKKSFKQRRWFLAFNDIRSQANNNHPGRGLCPAGQGFITKEQFFCDPANGWDYIINAKVDFEAG